jgi:hypothetical protein
MACNSWDLIEISLADNLICIYPSYHWIVIEVHVTTDFQKSHLIEKKEKGWTINQNMNFTSEGFAHWLCPSSFQVSIGDYCLQQIRQERFCVEVLTFCYYFHVHYIDWHIWFLSHIVGEACTILLLRWGNKLSDEPRRTRLWRRARACAVNMSTLLSRRDEWEGGPRLTGAAAVKRNRRKIGAFRDPFWNISICWHTWWTTACWFPTSRSVNVLIRPLFSL